MPVAFPTTVWDVLKDPKRDRRQKLEFVASRYRAPIIRYARYLGMDQHAAEDIAQNVLIKLCTSDVLDRLHGRFRTLIICLIRNAVADFRSGEKREREKTKLAAERIPGAHDEDAFNRLWAEAVFNEAFREMRREYSDPQRYRTFEVFQQHLLEGKSSRDIARDLNRPEAHVRVMLSRARKELRRRILTQIRLQCSSEEEFRDETRILFRYLQ